MRLEMCVFVLMFVCVYSYSVVRVVGVGPRHTGVVIVSSVPAHHSESSVAGISWFKIHHLESNVGGYLQR